MKLPHDSSQVHPSAHQPLRRQDGRSRSCDVTAGLLQRPAAQNFHSKRGKPAGRIEFTRSDRVSSNVVIKHHRTEKVTSLVTCETMVIIKLPSSPTKHVQPGCRPTCRRSSRTMNQADHCVRLMTLLRPPCAKLVCSRRAFSVNGVEFFYPSTEDRLSHCLLLNVF